MVWERGWKGKRFYGKGEMFWKVFFEKVFFGKLDKRGEVDGGEVLWVVGGLGGVR